MTGQNKLPPELRDIWTDCYKLHAAFEGMGTSVKDWDAFLARANEIYEKHGRHGLAKELVYAVVGYIEECRRGKGDMDEAV